MLIGMVSCVVWRWGFRFNVAGLSDIHEIIPSFILAFAAYLIIAKMTQDKAPDKEHLDMVFGN